MNDNWYIICFWGFCRFCILDDLHREMLGAISVLIVGSEPHETGEVCTSDIENAAYNARAVIAKAKERM